MSTWGRIVEVELTSGRVAQRDLTEAEVRLHLGGLGLNAALILDRLASISGPLSPDNVVAISPGLLTGTAAPSSSRIHVNSISPLSGLIASSNFGGSLGGRLQALGIAGLLITGRAEAPVRLHISEQGLELIPAGDLWGLDTRQTLDRLTELPDAKDMDSLTIGPAGENLVRFACLISGRDHAAGRTGLGAVFGSKNLKAVTCASGFKKEKMSPQVRAAVKAYIEKMKANESRWQDFTRYGSAVDVEETDQAGNIGAYNYRDGQFKGAHDLDAKQLTRFVTGKKACPRCPIHCIVEMELQSGPYKGFKGAQPEYETMIDFGPRLGLSDPEAVIYLSNLCNILGLDTVSAAAVAAFALDLFEQGIITKADTGGRALNWGDAGAAEGLIRDLAARQGLGDVLAEGVRRAAEKIGRGAEKYAYHVKSVETYGADPRGMMGTALAYAVSPRGADFTSSYPIPEFRYSAERAEAEFGTDKAIDFSATEGKAEMIAMCMAVCTVIDSLGVCKVPALSISANFELELEAELLKAIKGLELSPAELKTIGRRIINMEKLINARLGADRTSDNLPLLFQEKAIPDGPAKGRKVVLEPMVSRFYELMGWDDEGRPRPETLKELGLK